MKLSQYFPVSTYGDVVTYGDEDLKRGNVGPCQVCGDDTAFWCLFMMPFQACSTECLEGLRQQEAAQSRPSCNVHVAHSPECLDCQRADADDLRTKLAAEKDQHHFVHRLLEKARADAAAILEFARESFRVDARIVPDYEQGWNDAFAKMLDKMEQSNPGAPLLAELERLRAEVRR